VIDPVAGSGSSLLAAINCGRTAYGFEIKKDFHRDALKMLEERKSILDEIEKHGFSPTEQAKTHPSLFAGLAL
jgi:DNA modification methylase